MSTTNAPARRRSPALVTRRNGLAARPVLALILACLSGLLVACASGTDSVRTTMAENRRNFAEPERLEAAAFLVRALDAHMMTRHASEFAKDNAASPGVRDSADDMTGKQLELIVQIHDLAIDEAILLPVEVSNDRARALEDLRTRTGAGVDERR